MDPHFTDEETEESLKTEKAGRGWGPDAGGVAMDSGLLTFVQNIFSSCQGQNAGCFVMENAQDTPNCDFHLASEEKAKILKQSYVLSSGLLKNAVHFVVMNANLLIRNLTTAPVAREIIPLKNWLQGK